MLGSASTWTGQLNKHLNSPSIDVELTMERDGRVPVVETVE
jgi:hypothetical protein